MLKMALLVVICWLTAVRSAGAQAHSARSWLDKLIDYGRTGRINCGYGAWPPPALCQGICCPRFTKIGRIRGYDERQYDAMTFAYIVVRDMSPKAAQAKGLKALCKYTGGSSEGGQKIPMSGPVLTSISYSEDNLGCKNYTIALYLPPSYEPFPTPYDHQIKFMSIPSCIIYVHSGSAADCDDALKMELGSMLLKDLPITGQSNGLNLGTGTYFTATYRVECNIPHRVDEVWFIPATGSDMEAVVLQGTPATSGIL